MNEHLGQPDDQRAACTGCGDLLDARFDRRRFLHVAVGGVIVAALTPAYAFAATAPYDAMLLTCIDPRMQSPVFKYTAGRDLTGKCSQFTIAGAGIGVVAPAFKDWHKTFWDNLGASIQLHKISKVIVINHRDCGAAKIAYGEVAVSTLAAETKTHRDALTEFRRELNARHPQLGVETGLMALDGTMEMMS